MSDEVLRGYRKSIDNIDAALVFMLAERFKVTQAVGRYKATAGLPPADPGREERQIAAAAQAGAGGGARSGILREIPALHHRRGDPPPHARAQRSTK